MKSFLMQLSFDSGSNLSVNELLWCERDCPDFFISLFYCLPVYQRVETQNSALLALQCTSCFGKRLSNIGLAL
jgi:hypothetical protein